MDNPRSDGFGVSGLMRRMRFAYRSAIRDALEVPTDLASLVTAATLANGSRISAAAVARDADEEDGATHPHGLLMRRGVRAVALLLATASSASAQEWQSNAPARTEASAEGGVGHAQPLALTLSRTRERGDR